MFLEKQTSIIGSFYIVLRVIEHRKDFKLFN